MITPGILDYVGTTDESSECQICGAKARIGGGACVCCLLRAGLDEEAGNEMPSWDQTLREIEIRDSDCRVGDRQILERIGRIGRDGVHQADDGPRSESSP
jgi:hypothetical protein